jgi:hypothetical protein
MGRLEGLSFIALPNWTILDNMKELGEVPVKVNRHSWVTVNDVGKAEDAHGIQTNIVRIDGQRSAYIPS